MINVIKNENGWTNSFQLKVSYDIELITDIFELENTALIENIIDNRSLIMIDDNVYTLHHKAIHNYYNHHQVTAKLIVLKGNESNKRFFVIKELIDQLCSYGLKRREPIIAIGGGVVLDIVGMVANLYRRGVPYIRVPTTLLGIVDASVGVKNGVDYDSQELGCFKNRVGSFYPPLRVLIDKKFITTQDDRNIINGCGEILKLALVRSLELFELLETYAKEIIRNKFQCNIGQRVIKLSIQIMLEEIGPNLWEQTLERCVDFGHTFSKVIEMIPNINIYHGEAVNIDGYICITISKNRGLITQNEYDRICNVMKNLGLPLMIQHVDLDILVKGLVEATEHRHGKQRIPLITGIGSYTIVNDIRNEELQEAI